MSLFLDRMGIKWLGGGGGEGGGGGGGGEEGGGGGEGGKYQGKVGTQWVRQQP